MKSLAGVIVLLTSLSTLNAQPDRWQQRIKYQINVNVDVTTNRFTGTEKIDYWNNSPDTLNRIFFHLYWNAFQPNSMTDVRSRELGKTILRYNEKNEPVYDWDVRVKDRIAHLKPTEIGYDTVKSIKVNGVEEKLIYHESVLEVRLDKPLLPQSKTSMDVSFMCQVPLQILRSGRDNAEGIRYSMSQWYPKMAEYDYQGWDANPFVEREFYGVWGDFDVNITIDKSYLVAASGTIQNANEVGFGYQADGAKVEPPKGSTLTWKFAGQTIHDFVWAADPTYELTRRQLPNGPLLYFVHKKVDSMEARWKAFADTMALSYPFMAKTFGQYPYKNYSFIQGGDGGMEYPMATLIKSSGIANGTHEWMHSWYQGMMGNSESLYSWLDEGFAEYAQKRVSAAVSGDTSFVQQGSYTTYNKLVKSGKEEPLSTHADHYNTNYAFVTESYSKGAVFVMQLGYIVGDKVLDKILLEYYNEWRFKHPNPNDFIRVAEKVSGMELQWYKEYWIYTTKNIDYAVGDINNINGTVQITLKRIGYMPMPIDVLITYKDGTKELHYIPMNLMYGSKPAENDIKRIEHPEWRWTDPEYQMPIGRGITDIKEIEIDPSLRMADINRINNKLVVPG